MQSDLSGIPESCMEEAPLVNISNFELVDLVLTHIVGKFFEDVRKKLNHYLRKHFNLDLRNYPVEQTRLGGSYIDYKFLRHISSGT